MLCLKAEAIGNDLLAYPNVIHPTSLGRTIQHYFQRGGRELRRRNKSFSSVDESVLSSGLEEIDTVVGVRQREGGGKIFLYRALLEKDVQNLQRQLQEEIDLHIFLKDAAVHTPAHLYNSSGKIPDKAQELLSNISLLEITVLRLEQELVALHFKLSQERNERRLAQYQLRHLLSPLRSQSPSSSSSLQTCSPTHLRELLQASADRGNSQPVDSVSPTEYSRIYDTNIEGVRKDVSLLQEYDKDFLNGNFWCDPNKLSEQMVRSMRDVFLHLSDPSILPPKLSSKHTPSLASPRGHLSCYSGASYSDSSASLVRSPTVDLQPGCGDLAAGNAFDPYKFQGKLNWIDIGRYSLAAEVSWMSVGREQLEYAAEALKRYRGLVEWLAKVKLSQISCNGRLAFWINLYNALMMHAYLAYGVPKSDIKLFSLMQKASYTVGNHSFSAADIEYIILKMKPPSHRPQIALALALHKFKVSEEQKKHSIDSQEPMLAFAISCGMYSSPAVRIFTANNVRVELDNCLKDYIQATVGISDKGKLLVPKLLYSYTKGITEDSLLVDWLCRFLTPEQVATVQDCISRRRQRLLGARSFEIIPFDTRFRYLFLPDNRSSSL